MLICVVVLGAFSSSLGNGFNYDDEVNIIENPHYRGLGPAQLRWMFSTFHMGHYQPLAWVTLGLDYVIWGKNPFGYHLTNLLLHMGSAVLVYVLGLALLGSGRKGALWDVHFGALAAALLFAIHPLRVESVAWVTERRDVLSSFFLLLAVLFYLRARGGAKVARRGLWFGLALGTFALSLLSRAMGVTLPVILLLLDWYPLGRLKGESARRACVEKIPFFVLAAAFAVIAPLAQHSVAATAPLAEHGVIPRLAQACYGLVFYLWKTVAPFGLSPLYEVQIPLEVLSVKYLVPAVVVLLGVLALLRYGRRSPGLTLVAAAYVVLLAPVLGFVQSGRQEVADRYSYLPAMGWAILAGAGLVWLWRRPRNRGLARTVAGLAVAGIAGLGVLTWRQCLVWRTPESLWAHAARCAPSATVHQNLGAAFAQTGRLGQAIEQYRAAVGLEPLHSPAWYGLAKALTDAKRLEEAAAAWEQVLQHEPKDVRARLQYARVLHARGRSDDALRECSTAAGLDAQSAEARINLAALLIERQRLDEAVDALHQALRIDPNHPDAHYNLANVLAGRGDVAGAVAEYRQALAVRPDFPEAGINLGAALARLGLRDEALAELREVLRRHPNHPDAQRALRALLGAGESGG